MRRLDGVWRVRVLLCCVATVILLGLVLEAGGEAPGAYADTGYQTAPYVDMSNSAEQALDAAIGQAGLVAYTAAFITGNGCTPIWGDAQGLDSSVASDEIARARGEGAQAIVAFGGAAGAELAQSCPDVGALTAAYRSVVDKYHVDHLDFDIEGAAIADRASIARRFQAISALEKQDPALVVSVTIPVLPNGPDFNGQSFLHEAADNGARIDLVNAMTMDYGSAGTEMGDAAISAANGTLDAVRQVWPEYGWGNVGITPMIGQNDSAGEIFTLDDARRVAAFARANGVGRLAFWSISRDQPCAGAAGGAASPLCSSVAQASLDYMRAFSANRGGSNLGHAGIPSGGNPGQATAPDAKPAQAAPAGSGPARQPDTGRSAAAVPPLVDGASGMQGVEAGGVQAWQPGVGYATSQQVTYDGRIYQCRQGHTSQSNWDPPDVPALWQVVGAGQDGGSWQPGVGYATGQQVTYRGKTYRCVQGHSSQPDWDPADVPALWQPVG